MCKIELPFIKKDEKNLLDDINNKDIENVISTLENSTKNIKILNLNEIKDEFGNFPLLRAFYKNNIEIIK
eukprot:jgi/Orpsp1_1/1192194/evm.model.d7180000091245.1